MTSLYQYEEDLPNLNPLDEQPFEFTDDEFEAKYGQSLSVFVDRKICVGVRK